MAIASVSVDAWVIFLTISILPGSRRNCFLTFAVLRIINHLVNLILKVSFGIIFLPTCFNQIEIFLQMCFIDNVTTHNCNIFTKYLMNNLSICFLCNSRMFHR